MRTAGGRTVTGHTPTGADRLLIRPTSGRQTGTGHSARTHHSKDTHQQGHAKIESQTKSTGATLATTPDEAPTHSSMRECPLSNLSSLGLPPRQRLFRVWRGRPERLRPSIAGKGGDSCCCILDLAKPDSANRAADDGRVTTAQIYLLDLVSPKQLAQIDAAVAENLEVDAIRAHTLSSLTATRSRPAQSFTCGRLFGPSTQRRGSTSEVHLGRALTWECDPSLLAQEGLDVPF